MGHLGSPLPRLFICICIYIIFIHTHVYLSSFLSICTVRKRTEGEEERDQEKSLDAVAIIPGVMVA